MAKKTDAETLARIQELRKELRELEKTVLRSDWHAGFEGALRIDLHKYGNAVHLLTEEEIGEMPPRADFMVLVEDEDVAFDEAIFQIFRKINVIEYKNPSDSLNERTLWKASGYASLYIGVAEHEGDRPADQVTISIFRAGKNPEMFAKMEREGTLVRGEVPGIYQVRRITNLPFQIVITNELEGDEYAAYRALTERAKEEDVAAVLDRVGASAGSDSLVDHFAALLRLVLEKNPQYFSLAKRREKDMDEHEYAVKVFMEVFKDEVDAKVNTAVDKIKVELDAANEKADKAKAEADKANAEADKANAEATEARAEADKVKAEAIANDAKWQKTLAEKEEIIKAQSLTNISNIMSSLQISAEKAMDLLKIPVEERHLYVALLPK